MFTKILVNFHIFFKIIKSYPNIHRKILVNFQKFFLLMKTAVKEPSTSEARQPSACAQPRNPQRVAASRTRATSWKHSLRPRTTAHSVFLAKTAPDGFAGFRTAQEARRRPGCFHPHTQRRTPKFAARIRLCHRLRGQTQPGHKWLCARDTPPVDKNCPMLETTCRSKESTRRSCTPFFPSRSPPMGRVAM